MVTKHLKSIFVFMSHGYIDTGTSKVLTHFLEKNEKLSVWDIVGKEKCSFLIKIQCKFEIQPPKTASTDTRSCTARMEL